MVGIMMVRIGAVRALGLVNNLCVTLCVTSVLFGHFAKIVNTGNTTEVLQFLFVFFQRFCFLIQCGFEFLRLSLQLLNLTEIVFALPSLCSLGLFQFRLHLFDNLSKIFVIAIHLRLLPSFVVLDGGFLGVDIVLGLEDTFLEEVILQHWRERSMQRRLLSMWRKRSSPHGGSGGICVPLSVDHEGFAYFSLPLFGYDGDTSIQ
mmetsp:Transcript_11038/g.19577  ORF Transcript_11038/g.19577 Transcript_11038/m.19577 type:complete len:204 (+) Transcript_11038:288-899(+)